MPKRTIPIFPSNTLATEDMNVGYIPMPQGMNTYHIPASLPEPEAVSDKTAVKEIIEQLQRALNTYQVGSSPVQIALNHLDATELKILGQILGEGEVSILCQGQHQVKIQESVMAGIWQIQYLNEQGLPIELSLEVADIPTPVQMIIQAEINAEVDLRDMPQHLMNAPSILAEVQAKQQLVTSHTHEVINLTSLPITVEDQTYLKKKLGVGPITILSRGYGNCRITSAALRYVWWVQYFNSMDTLILNTLEIVNVPPVARAAADDLQDSAKRLVEIMRDYLRWVN